MLQIKSIHTPCKKCVFAIYDNKTQIGCHIGYLEKYKNISEILEVYDDEKEFFVINDKKCIGYREPGWFNKLGIFNATIEEQASRVLFSNTVDYTLLVDLKYFSQTDIDNLSIQLKNLSYKPKKIIFVRYQNEQKPYHAYKYIESIFKTKELSGCSWRIQTMVNDDTYYEIVNNAINLNKKTRFFCCLEKPVDNISKVVEKANDIVYNDLKNFIVISNLEKTLLIFSGSLYRYSAVVNKTNILRDQNNYIIV